MSNSSYLDLVNQLLVERNEVEITSSEFSGVVGLHKHAKNAINNALREIDSYQFKWPFNYESRALNATAYVQHYNWASDHKVVDEHSFIIKDPDTGVYFELDVMELDEWRLKYRAEDLKVVDDATTGGDAPTHVIMDATGFILHPVPDKAYEIQYGYYKLHTKLVNDTDVTVVPQAFDHVIMLGGLKWLNAFLDNAEMMQIHNQAFDKALKHMRAILINDELYMRDHRVNF